MELKNSPEVSSVRLTTKVPGGDILKEKPGQLDEQDRRDLALEGYKGEEMTNLFSPTSQCLLRKYILRKQS